ncbi:L-ascorbate oxidase-like [Copidosoma floridanum]|uniref:L-ascorbate oxidase-like n=1 Tax=Copidosoma floridanum TaxID=29053 RepID=UPI0006C96D56|nr:L-ascorbate oxidase-like [Copidosoma floridanum]
MNFALPKVIGIVVLQPPGINVNSSDLIDWSQHPCKRKCVDGVFLTCHYRFTIELYSTMSRACYNCPYNVTDCSRPHCIPADGKEKVVMVINRLLPGPTIEVCKGDRIIVDVTNEMPTDTTSIHWHGIHQKGTPFMDGVPYVTQCPILPGQTFSYNFVVDKPGTYLYHSHSGDQRADGLFGGLVVRESRETEPASRLYDVDEHMIVVNDWTSTSGSEAYVLEYQNSRAQDPHTILVNGFGRFNDNRSELLPLAVFEVEQGKRYRFRMANLVVQDCPVHLSINNHTMLAISVDGADIEPIEVDSIRSLSGERYDFVVEANQEIDNYLMYFVGDIVCERLGCHQVAVLHYKGAPDFKLMNVPTAQARLSTGLFTTNIRELNPYNQGMETPGSYCIASLNSAEPDDLSISRDPDHQIYISYDFYEMDNDDYHRRDLYGYYQVNQLHRQRTLQLNRISFRMPRYPLQTQHDLIKPGQLCNASSVQNCNEQHCICTHVLQVQLNSVVELVMIDNGGFSINHPIHLHGVHFRVVAMEKLGDTISVDRVKELDRAGKISRKLKGAPLKDTVIVPSGGYTIIRWVADNPGYWFFHCHFDPHSSNGMALVFKVGDHEDFPKTPKNFPSCQDFKT